LFKGYRDNPQATANAFDVDGFYRTGDRVFVKDGKVFIDGRTKDIMKVKGWQVSPAELENILLQHPAVADVAVVGFVVYHTDAVEEVLPKAFVVRKTRKAKTRGNGVGGGGTGEGEGDVVIPYLVDEEELVEFVAGKVVSYKRLTGGVEFIEEIPRSSAGKVLRKKLSEGEKWLPAKLEGVSLEKA
jgi:4-coumarate--CoA ligase